METFTAIAALQSLAQETRLEVFRRLVKAGPEGLSAGEIADALGVPAPTLSFHLNHLVNATLLSRARDGRAQIYAVRFEQVNALLGFLMKDCCQGRADIRATNTNDCRLGTDEECCNGE